jgi:arsenite-transporting ATPase
MAPPHGNGAIATRGVPLLLNEKSTTLELREQQFIFVGGKGGVGKTTIASALGMSLADRGLRCLLVSTDQAHSLGDLFGAHIGDHEQLLQPNLYGLEIDPDQEVERHLETVRRNLREFVRPGMYAEVERQVELARLSPGGVEAAMLERIAGLMLQTPERYDHVIFDTAPTGQTLRLLSLPTVMTAWTEGLLQSRRRADATGDVLARVHGSEAVKSAFTDQPSDDQRSERIRKTLLARRHKFQEARRLLLDVAATAFILVLIPEKLAVLETKKTLVTLQAFDVPVLSLVVNRVLPDEHVGDFLEQRRNQETKYLGQIVEFADGLSVNQVPLLPCDVEGPATLRMLVTHLLSD